MPFNSDYIQKKEFHVALKGYKQDEVDKFLDILAFEFEKLMKKNIELQESLDKLKYEGFDEESRMNKVIQDVLVSAHKIADEVKKKAEDEAAQHIKSKKESEDAQISDLLEKKKQLEERVNYLFDTYEDLRSKIKNSLKSFENFLLEENIPVRSVEQEEITNTAESIPEAEEKNIITEDFKKSTNEQTQKPPLVEEAEEQELNFKEEDEAAKEEEPKRVNRKQDIGNPDIISEFFNSDDN